MRVYHVIPLLIPTACLWTTKTTFNSTELMLPHASISCDYLGQIWEVPLIYNIRSATVCTLCGFLGHSHWAPSNHIDHISSCSCQKCQFSLYPSSVAKSHYMQCPCPTLNHLSSPSPSPSNHHHHSHHYLQVYFLSSILYFLFSIFYPWIPE